MSRLTNGVAVRSVRKRVDRYALYGPRFFNCAIHHMRLKLPSALCVRSNRSKGVFNAGVWRGIEVMLLLLLGLVRYGANTYARGEEEKGDE